MQKNVLGVTEIILGAALAIVLALLFLLTQENYTLLRKSNDAVIKTGSIVNGYEKASANFKNAIIYISTYKNSPSQAYVNAYGKGLWEIRDDIRNLKKLVSKPEQIKLDTIAKQIYEEEEWLLDPRTYDPELADEREAHIETLITIQDFFDGKLADLSKQSINAVKAAEHSLVRLHYWIIALIISTSVIILITLLFIRKQMNRVKRQNRMLMEIAWMQSHKVRAQIAVLLGLGQLFDHDNPSEAENGKVVNYMVETANKLDTIVKEINDKADVK